MELCKQVSDRYYIYFEFLKAAYLWVDGFNTRQYSDDLRGWRALFFFEPEVFASITLGLTARLAPKPLPMQTVPDNSSGD